MAIRILHVGNEGSGALLRRAAGVSQEPLNIVSDDAEEAHGDVVVFGSGAHEPLARAQEILKARPTAQILFLVQRDILERFRSTLPFVPHMASAWTADIASAPEAIAGIIAKAARAAARRLSNRTVASRINLQLTQKAAQEKADDAEKSRLQQITLSEEYLATLLTQAPDAFIALSGSGGIVAWNDAATRLFGVAAEFAIGADVGAVFPAEMESELRELTRRAASGRAFTGRQVAFSTSQGAKWVELSVAPVRDARQNIQTLSITVRDVTDRQQADARREALVKLTDRLRDLDDASEIGFAAAEILARTLGVSRAGYGIIDTRAETISIERDWNAPGIKSLAGVLHFRDYGSYIEDLKRGETVICGDAEMDPRTQANAAALSAISARSFVNMPVTEAGRFVALLYLNHADARPWSAEELSFIREIAERTRTATERRRAEAALRANEARLRFLDALGAETAKRRDADAILATTTEMVGEHLKVAICAYADMDPDQDGFTILGDWSAPGSSGIVGHYRLADFGRLASSTLGAGRPLVIHDVIAELAPEEAANFQKLGIASTICMPLLKEGRLSALMAIHDRVPRIWTDAELALLREVAERSWAHIERVRSEARIRSNERRFREELEAKVAERTAALALSEKSMRTVFETSHQQQGLLTPDGRVVYSNATSLASIDRTLKDVVDRFFWDTPWFTGTPGMPEAIRDAVARVAAGETATLSMALDLPTGHRIYEFSMRPVLDEAGRVAAMVPEAVEITARVQAEEALRQAQKMEAVGQLTGGIAHDFNNLLAAISGSLELLERRLSEGRLSGVQRYISAAQEGARRAATLTQRLLAFSRRQTLDPRPADLNKLVAGMEDLIRRSVGPTIELEVVGAGGLWATKADISQLENSLLNLCINARDAMAPDGGRLTIETANKWLDEHAARERELSPGQYISLCVTDTGSGMTPEVIARAFDPFYTTKPLGEGTGLGLSMVYGFVRQSGGQVRIYSEIGGGTTVCLYLPRYIGEVDSPEDKPDHVTGEGQGETVLVVEDEPTIRMLIVEELEENGYRAIEAADGPSGLRIIQTDTRIDLLVTDVGLPGGMNGRQVADAARLARPDLKVLFITGFAENAAVGNGLLGPGMEVITKPFVMAAFVNKIRDLIDSVRSH